MTISQIKRQKMFLQQWNQNELKEMRLKEVLILMVGYSISEIEHLLASKQGSNHNTDVKQYDNQTPFQFNTLKLFTYEMNNSQLITKLYLIQLFSTTINILKNRIAIISHQNLYTIFKLLIVEGFKSPQFEENILKQILNEILNEHIRSANDQHEGSYLKKNLQQSQQKLLQKEVPQQQQALSHSVIISQPTQQPNEVCDICLCQFSQHTQLVNQRSFKLTKCQHQFHKQCLLQMIKQHINSEGDILFYQTEKRKEDQQSFSCKQKQIMTKIKCPNFQSCKMYFNLQEIHHFILNLSDNQKVDQQNNLLMNKIYQLTFNSYLTNQGIKPFEKFKQSGLFYCKTLGCNSVYEISDSKKPDNFICVTCKSSFCLMCFSTLHPTMTCRQNLISNSTLPEDEQLQKFIKTLKKPYKKCPKCKFYVDNWRGCSTVKCRCGAQFCFKCGNIGCPHAKCLKEIQKEEKQKLRMEQQQKQYQRQKNQDKKKNDHKIC